MLRYKSDNEKTYEERMAQAIMQVPLYSSEWTNYNQSDPGITILESLSLFETLQQSHIAETPPAVKAALLKMMGFVPKKGRCSRVLLLPQNAQEEFVVPKGQKFTIGGLSFESIRDINVGAHNLTNIYSIHNEPNPTEDDPEAVEIQTQDMKYLLDKDIRLSVKPFSEHPAVGDNICFLCSGLPAAGEDVTFYIEVSENSNRNTFDASEKNIFAEIEWQIYANGDFVPVIASDHTNGLLTSGDVTIRIPNGKTPEIYQDSSYCIRAVLTKANYDIPPALTGVFGFLFELWQQDTRAFTFTGNRATSIAVRNDLTKDHYVLVFGREEKGTSYRQYTPYHGEEVDGRYMEIEEEPDRTIYRFKKNKYGYAPEKGKNAVRVVGYTEEIMRRYKLGVVEGYDDQRIKLPLQNIVTDNFFIIAKRLDENGQGLFDFVRPGHSGEGELFYHLHERTGELQIVDAGDYIGAELFMGGCAVYRGDLGNVRAGNEFKTKGPLSKIKFVNPCVGTGGQYPEDLESVRKRFIKDLDTPASAVTASDYEYLVLNTPGLCIRKAKAYMNPARNEVRVAVLPDIIGKNGMPVLNSDYQKIIEDRLEDHRLLSTKISVIKPAYAPVNVAATIMVNQSYEHTEERLHRIVEKMINYMESDKNFGELLKFEEVFHALEDDPGVVYVQQLTLRPAKNQLASRQEQNILPAQNAILIPGNIALELITYHK